MGRRADSTGVAFSGRRGVSRKLSINQCVPSMSGASDQKNKSSVGSHVGNPWSSRAECLPKASVPLNSVLARHRENSARHFPEGASRWCHTFSKNYAQRRIPALLFPPRCDSDKIVRYVRGHPSSHKALSLSEHPVAHLILSTGQTAIPGTRNIHLTRVPYKIVDDWSLTKKTTSERHT